MAWRSDLPGGFDPQQCVFAGNAETEAVARRAIDAAKSAGATREDFVKEMIWHMASDVLCRSDLQAFVAVQIARLHELWPIA